MVEKTFKLTGVCASVALVTLVACAPATDQNETVAATPAAPAAPMYISNKPVSTDCGVFAPPDPPPGFARTPGGTAANMPPPLAARQAVGADRPIADTVAEKVSPGVTLIDPGFRKPFYLINNDKEVIGEFAGDYLSFMQLLPNGNILGSSNMYSDTFRDGGGHTGCVEEYRPDGSLVYRLALASDDYIHHHDVQKLANGNILALIWERVSTDEAIALGRNPEHVAENGDFWFDGFVEVDPLTAEIVWEWSVKNHLIQDFDPDQSNYGVIADNPQQVERFNAADEKKRGKMFGFFVGQVMKASKGKANPKQVNELLKQKL